MTTGATQSQPSTPAGPRPLALADPEAVTSEAREALASGWKTEPSGATALADLRASYHGPSPRAGDLTGYEAVVNGWRVAAQDITTQGNARECEPLPCAVSYARQAMGDARDLPDRDR